MGLAQPLGASGGDGLLFVFFAHKTPIFEDQSFRGLVFGRVGFLEDQDVLETGYALKRPTSVLKNLPKHSERLHVGAKTTLKYKETWRLWTLTRP